jgi:argininosuccinate synthase
MNMNVNELKGKTLGFAASGGLDSCTITRWLTDHGVRVVCFTADLAQPDEKNLDDVRKRMLASGAEDWVLVDAKHALVEAGLKLIQGQSCYEGKYWNTTGIARYVTTQAILAEMKQRGIRIFSHGATGRGNDQVRFQLATNMLDPEIEVYAPWRDELFLKRFGGRSEMIEFCQSSGIPITASKSSPYSTDANCLGLTHEAGVLESLETAAHSIKPGMGVFAQQAPDQAELFEVLFERGRPVQINGRSVSSLEALLMANALGGKHGIGIGIHLVENRYVGIKSRGVYESPGMELLGTCYAILLQTLLDRRARELFDQLSLALAKQIYQGYWFDLNTQMILAALEKVTALATGRVRVSLYKGNISFVALQDVAHSLYSESNASMEKMGTYNHADAEGLLRIFGVSARVLATAKQTCQ